MTEMHLKAFLRMDLVVGKQSDFLPFGEIISTDSGTSTHKFTGDERDSETSLDHTWFRQYSSQFARWTSPDRLGGSILNPQSLNRYSYVGNNPTNFVDPIGLDPKCHNHKLHGPFGPQACGTPPCLIEQGCFDPGFNEFNDPFAFIDVAVLTGYVYYPFYVNFDNGEFVGEALIPLPVFSGNALSIVAGDFSSVPAYSTQSGGTGRETRRRTPGDRMQDFNSCLSQAVDSGALHLTIDAISMVPGFGEVGAAMSVATTDYGDPTGVALTAAGTATTIASRPANALFIASYSLRAAEAIPGLATGVAFLSLGYDGYSAYKKAQACSAVPF